MTGQKIPIILTDRVKKYTTKDFLHSILQGNR